MPRFRLTIEYAGTRYSGWQIQKNARTVQGEIDRAVRTVTGRKDFELYGAGRTDAGVHALAQVAHLDVASNVPAETMRRRLNDELPADINILAQRVVPHRFHARHDAVARRYLYQIARRRTAFAKPYVWWVKDDLAVDRMRQAASALVGMRDFAAFAEEDDRRFVTGSGVVSSNPRPKTTPDPVTSRQSTLVLIERLDVGEDGDLVLVAIEGSHFLWKMVRRIVGVLVEIGKGAMAPDADVSHETAARLTAPAAGLFLERVYYKNDTRDAALRAATPLSPQRP